MLSRLASDAVLPLTCTRSGTCCHGKDIPVNPWEVASLATAAGEPVAAWAAVNTTNGGVRLAMSGAAGWRGLAACGQYDPATGCRHHADRPLACRLYPLGRERRGSLLNYVHDGRRFPCLDGCPGVQDLPSMTVAEYLAGQQVGAGEAVQDAYVELVQDLGEAAFALWVDSGLAARGERRPPQRWRLLGGVSPARLAEGMPEVWRTRLLLPELPMRDGPAFVAAHHAWLQTALNEAFATCQDADSLVEASVLCVGMALLLARSLGADAPGIADAWVMQAKRIMV